MNDHGRPEGDAALPASGLVRFADSFEALLRKIYTPISWVGAATLAALVVAMFYSVIARRFFNSPLEGSGDIIEMSLLIMTATVLGLEHLGHEKMTVDILIKRFSKKAQADHRPDHLLPGHRHPVRGVLRAARVRRQALRARRDDARRAGAPEVPVRLPDRLRDLHPHPRSTWSGCCGPSGR